VVLAVLRSPIHGLLDPGLCELRYRRRRTGTTVSLPVLYAIYARHYVVVVGDAADKRWWRTFIQPWPVQVRQGGRLRPGLGRMLNADDPEYQTAWQA
jgi:hypothetical protein